MVKIGATKKKGRSKDGSNLLVALVSIPVLLVIAVLCYAIYEIRSQEPGIVSSSSSSSTNSNNSKPKHLRSPSAFRFNTDLLGAKRGGKLQRTGADALWDMLLEEAVAIRAAENPAPIHVMEVGMHRPKQCLQAASMQLQAYCVEPSPNSIGRIIHGFEQAPEETRKNIRFYQMAAGPKSGLNLEFSSSGGTGDHVGGAIDIWTMKKLPENAALPGHMTKVIVKSVAIDDIIYDKVEPSKDFAGNGISNNIDKMFLIKVDTQGFEPSVFAGLKKAIANGKIDYIITEYWPKGIDFMNDMVEECVKPLEILKLLQAGGYSLYAMPNVSHPSEDVPKEAKHWLNDSRINNIPYHDVEAHCKWFYEVERKFPSSKYKYGYWTDILAVAPDARLPKKPVSELGGFLQKNLK